MNKTITMPQLVELITVATNSSYSSAQLFVTELFNIISDALAQGESVKVKSLGVFSVGGLDGKTITFMPDKELADAINQPFAFFEAVELDDDLSEEELNEAAKETAETPNEPIEEIEPEIDARPITERPEEETNDETPSHSNAQEEEHPEEIIEAPEEKPIENEEAGIEQENDIEETTPEQPTEEATEIPAEAIGTTKEEPEATEIPAEEPDIEPQPAQETNIIRSEVVYVKQGPNPWLMLAIGLLIGVIVGYLLPVVKDVIYNTIPEAEKLAEPIAENSIEQPAQPLAKTEPLTQIESEPIDTIEPIITDTIGKNRFLTTMSRKYYGRYEFWVYIYLENSDKLAHPDKIKPGTVVVIPPAKKYGIDATNDSSVNEANAKIAEIYAPYQR